MFFLVDVDTFATAFVLGLFAALCFAAYWFVGHTIGLLNGALILFALGSFLAMLIYKVKTARYLRLLEIVTKTNREHGTSFSMEDSLGKKIYLDDAKKKILIIDGDFVRCDNISPLVRECNGTDIGNKVQMLFSLNDRARPSLKIKVDGKVWDAWSQRLGSAMN